MFLFRTTGDGNCLYSSISIMLVKSEKLCHVLRALSVIELTLNLPFYADHPFFKSAKDHDSNEHNLFVKTLSYHCAEKFNLKINNRKHCLLQQAKSASINFSWSPFVQLLVLSSVIRQQIRSIYPSTGGYFDKFFNILIVILGNYFKHYFKKKLPRICRPFLEAGIADF